MSTVVNVLLVETDEPALRERTEQLLMDGYAVDAVSHIDQARVKLTEGPDALVPSSEPEMTGLLRQVRRGEIPRADSRLPVLVLGVDDSAAVRYYRAGANVALPSESSGLLVAAGLEALARRAGSAETRVMRAGTSAVDRDARTADVDGRPVTLTRLEFDLLATLVGEPRRTFPRAELTREVWDYDQQAAGQSRTVDSDAHPVAAEARAGRRGVDGANRPRRRLEAHPMTKTLPPDAAGACRRARHSVTAVDPTPLGSSRSDTRVSQQRDRCPQIQSRWSECHVRRAMIGAMHEAPDHLLTDWSSDVFGYASAYRCSYTVVYMEAKEVS